MSEFRDTAADPIDPIDARYPNIAWIAGGEPPLHPDQGNLHDECVAIRAEVRELQRQVAELRDAWLSEKFPVE